MTGKFEREDAIMLLRLQIRKAYECLESEEEKKSWREVIEGGMGKNYEIWLDHPYLYIINIVEFDI